MKIIVVEIEEVEKYPPVITVINTIAKSGLYDVDLIALNLSDHMSKMCVDIGVDIYNVDARTKYLKNKLHRLEIYANYLCARKKVYKIIEDLYQEGDLIWVCSFATLKFLGKKILDYRYILHLFELVEELPLIPIVPLIKVNIERYMKKADCVIECEYNRAHITKAWFSLEQMPIVLPNKPLIPEGIVYEQVVSEEIVEKFEKMKGKKIILYQGVIGSERPIRYFVEAAKYFSEEYVLVIMGSGDTTAFENVSGVEVLPYIPAPYHLYITSKAYIGIVCYNVSNKGYSFTSSLNTVYCAPNKIFEYAKYGVPILGNDLPGLKKPLSDYNCGLCVDIESPNEIIRAIDIIDKNYHTYQLNSNAFYDSVDIEKIVLEDILGK